MDQELAKIPQTSQLKNLQKVVRNPDQGHVITTKIQLKG